MPVLSGVIDFNGFLDDENTIGPLPVVKVSFVNDDERGLMLSFNVSRDGYTYTMQYSDGTLKESDIAVPLTVDADAGGGGGGGDTN